jgi:hypothetical protein
MTYEKQVEQFINQFDLTHAVTTDINYMYSYRRSDEYLSYFRKDLTIFINQINRRFYGRQTSKINYSKELPIIIPIIENLNNKFQPLHFHFALGNLREDKFTKDEIISKIKSSWKNTIFHELSDSKSIIVKEISNKTRWTNYITKELKYKNNECVLFDMIQTSKLVN